MTAGRRPGPLALLALLACAALSPQAGHAQPAPLTLPQGALRNLAEGQPARSYALPIGVYADHRVPQLPLEGDVLREAWRIEARGLTTLQLLSPLRDQLIAAGYEVLLDCADVQCGGFDFRFALDVLPAPDMYVDLFDYHVLTARRQGPGGPRHVLVLASRSEATGYVQIDRIRPPGSAPPQPDVAVDGTAPGSVPPPVDPEALIRTLGETGRVVLGDLNFTTGAADLSEGAYGSLAALAGYLAAHPGARLVLVGHTDSAGALETNIALSQRRAASVRDRLISTLGVDPGQLSAEGVGYLAPVAPNTTQDGRERNRRVEAVLLQAD